MSWPGRLHIFVAGWMLLGAILAADTLRYWRAELFYTIVRETVAASDISTPQAPASPPVAEWATDRLKGSKSEEMTTVVIARHDLSAGEFVRSADLTVIARPRALVDDRTYTAAQDVAGAFVTERVAAGDPVRSERLAFAWRRPVREEIEISDSGQLAGLRVGDDVDLLATWPHGPTETVATGATVLETFPDALTVGLWGRDADRVARLPGTVTFSVSLRNPGEPRDLPPWRGPPIIMR